ncbi:thioesterase family protein [Nocardia jiangxiensis]|uniref:Thioesterase family protein n=1 Tax=Nocardia jiangxiensis TaxID=282685 RepID=A0ABW6SGX6_9NOCA|nr:thioesterase family protein [Nocardia jiangxiensis]
MATVFPTFEQVLSIPDPTEATVTSDLIDMNGHMNVVHYLYQGSVGADAVMKRIGVDTSYRSRRQMTMFTAEHHLVYLSELREGDKFSVHTRILGRTDKAVHLMTFLVDRGRERLSNTLEIMLLHVDLTARRAVAIPEDIAAGLDDYIARSAALDWPAPTCGAIALRR